MTIHGVGIDVADPERFARLVARGGDRFVLRWFTAAEATQCGGAVGPLAVRYAAKEAVWKALGPSGWRGPLPWRDIEVLESGGRAAAFLRGVAADLAARVGVEQVSVSLCPPGEGRPALAVAIAGRP